MINGSAYGFDALHDAATDAALESMQPAEACTEIGMSDEDDMRDMAFWGVCCAALAAFVLAVLA